MESKTQSVCPSGGFVHYKHYDPASGKYRKLATFHWCFKTKSLLRTLGLVQHVELHIRMCQQTTRYIANTRTSRVVACIIRVYLWRLFILALTTHPYLSHE